MILVMDLITCICDILPVLPYVFDSTEQPALGNL